MTGKDEQEHWLARPATIKRLWWGFAVLLVITVLAQLIVHVKGYFVVDGWFGFGASYGFLACLAMVLFAKGIGFFLKRKERYYERDDDTGGDANA
ncbi:MAG: hypothetical protein OXF31_02160 [Gammaproteobacteria bacterium]|nr:hypothetical protein [Gammaproteobacteria bacterium]